MGAGIVDGHIVHRGGDGAVTALVPVSAIRLLGPHLVSDVVAAAARRTSAAWRPDAIGSASRRSTGLEHALELVATIDGVRFVNDSKATNVDAARRAIESFDAGVVAIVGGRFKGGDLRDLRPAVAARAAGVVAIGEARPLVHDALDDVVPVHDAVTMDEAVALAWRQAPPGRRRAARAGVRELRHVRGLRGARTGVQGGGRGCLEASRARDER